MLHPDYGSAQSSVQKQLSAEVTFSSTLAKTLDVASCLKFQTEE